MNRILTAIIVILLFGAVPAHAEEPLQLCLPASNWAVEIPSDDFVEQYVRTPKTKDTAQLKAENHTAGLFLTAFIEPAKGEVDSKAARMFYHERLKEAPVEFSDEKTYERGPFAILEYTWREVEGVEVNQRHLHIYTALQGSWVDLHFSKVNFTDADRPAFDSIVENVRLSERKESDLTSAEYILLGNEAARQGQCKEADANYQVALAINKVKTQLKKKDYFETLLYLGTCYSESGELEKAISTLQAGIQQDAANHRMHYALARTYAQLGEEGKAVASLTRVYEILAADSPIDEVPDPLEDSHFESMKKNPDFKKIAKKIAKENKRIDKEFKKALGGF